MKEINYKDALNLYGDYMKYDNKFKKIKEGEAKIFYLTDNDYCIVVDDDKIKDVKKLIFSSQSIICENTFFEELMNGLSEYDKVCFRIEDTFENEIYIEAMKKNGFSYFKEDKIITSGVTDNNELIIGVTSDMMDIKVTEYIFKIK